MSDDERTFIPGPSPHEYPSSPAPGPEGTPTRVPGPSERGEGSTPASESRAPSPVEPGEGIGGEAKHWRDSLPAIADRLREIGYDIASPQSGAPPGRSIVARRDLGDRAVVLAIDSGGRFRAEITWVVGEWPSQDEIAGVSIQVVDAVSRATTVTGQMAEPDQVAVVVAGLGTIAPWASVAESEALPPPT